MSERSVRPVPLERPGGEGPGRDRGTARGARPDDGPQRPAALRPSRTAVLAVAGGVVYALVAGGFRRLTVPAEFATFLPGVLITSVAVRRTSRRLPAPDQLDGRGSVPWGVLLVVFGVWELYADLCGSTPAHPTLSILMGPLLADPVHRAVGYMLWLAAGVWVVRR